MHKIREEILNETLFANDLEGTILPLISFDEFDSKIKKNSIVLGFYATNENAAADLAMFIDRTTIEGILDCEISPTINSEGNFMVFIELDYSITYKDLIHLFKVVQYLVGNLKWKIRAYKLKDVYPLTDKNIKILLDRVKNENK